MTDLEAAFLNMWQMLANGAGQPEQEYRFHARRRWRFDFAWPRAQVAVECEGGTWSRGRHVRGDGYRKDCEKYNTAALMGWRVFCVTAGMLRDDPVAVVEMVKAALNGSSSLEVGNGGVA